jgi:SAM-dependent methyltransferase
MIQAWKVPHILKGMLTYVPALNSWRLRRGSTGGSSSARYCYAVWLRHLVMLDRHGFNVKGSVVGELGPGDSIGAGLAALLSGADRYVGLDVMPYSATADLEQILTDLAQMFASREAIPGDDEFPLIRPRLASYAFPDHLVHAEALSEKIDKIMSDLRRGVHNGGHVSYHAPWTSVRDVAPGSLDAIFSQAVLQYLDDLEAAYRAMFTWLKPGGYASHATGFGAVDVSPYWNGHWAYTDLEWRLVRGRREWLMNRRPLSAHMFHARRAGFEVLHLDRECASGGLNVNALSPPFQALDAEDLHTRGAMLILQKPA